MKIFPNMQQDPDNEQRLKKKKSEEEAQQVSYIKLQMTASLFYSCPSGDKSCFTFPAPTCLMASRNEELSASFLSVSFAFCSLSPMEVKRAKLSAICSPCWRKHTADTTRFSSTPPVASSLCRRGSPLPVWPARVEIREKLPIRARRARTVLPNLTEVNAHFKRASLSEDVLMAERRD